MTNTNKGPGILLARTSEGGEVQTFEVPYKNISQRGEWLKRFRKGETIHWEAPTWSVPSVTRTLCVISGDYIKNHHWVITDLGGPNG